MPPQKGVNKFPGGREALRTLQRGKFLSGKVSRLIYLFQVRGAWNKRQPLKGRPGRREKVKNSRSSQSSGIQQQKVWASKNNLVENELVIKKWYAIRVWIESLSPHFRNVIRSHSVFCYRRLLRFFVKLYSIIEICDATSMGLREHVE